MIFLMFEWKRKCYSERYYSSGFSTEVWNAIYGVGASVLSETGLITLHNHHHPPPHALWSSRDFLFHLSLHSSFMLHRMWLCCVATTSFAYPPPLFKLSVNRAIFDFLKPLTSQFLEFESLLPVEDEDSQTRIRCRLVRSTANPVCNSGKVKWQIV